MPFPFTLPTTGFVDLGQSFSSNTHPSLLQATTQRRSHLRHVLKAHKRLGGAAQAANLRTVLDAVDSYLPYIVSVEDALSGKPVAGEHVDVTLLREPEFDWHPTLSSASNGKKLSNLTAAVAARAKGRWRQRGLDGEVVWALHTRAAVHTLLAREEIRPLLRTDVAPPEPEDRKAGVVAAMRAMLAAHAAHNRAAGVASGPEFDSAGAAPDARGETQRALATLAMAEATLTTVLKDDPFPVAVAEQTNQFSKEWMYKTSSVNVSRTRGLSFLCIAAAEHASVAAAILQNVKLLDDDIKQYAQNLHGVCRAKAARFQGIAAEAEGKTGVGIAWIQGAKYELGVKEKQVAKVLQNWKDKKEAERIESGKMSWGFDAGKADEGRVLDMIERKWTKLNDTMSMHKIPAFQSLLSVMPSGREMYKSTVFECPRLSEQDLAPLRAPPESSSSVWAAFDDSESETESQDPVGAFPGSSKSYKASNSNSTAF